MASARLQVLCSIGPILLLLLLLLFGKQTAISDGSTQRASTSAIVQGIHRKDHQAFSHDEVVPATVHARQLFESADYKRARDKGNKIICSFSDPSKAPAAKFTASSDLKDWGWDSTIMTGGEVTNILKNFATELKAKRLSADSPTVHGMSWRHARETVHDGKTYPATGGKYDVLYDPTNGMLVPASSYGPAWYLINKKGASANLPSGTLPPKLNVWSDVAFLTWLQGTTAQNRQSLRYVVNINCINQTSVDVVSEALKRDGVSSGIPPKWPGHTFALSRPGPFTHNDAYAAVLGTPNVLGSGWLILQHQQQLGNKKIGAITVWDSSGFSGSGGAFQLSVMVEVVGRT